jgi:hypothetical protein
VCALLAQQERAAGAAGALGGVNRAQLARVLALARATPPAWAAAGDGHGTGAPPPAALAGWLPVQN